MSILLESLRKSEAQRRIKDAPSIHSAEVYGSRPRNSRSWLVLVMIGLTAAAIVWLGWQQFAGPESDSGAPLIAATESAGGEEGEGAPGEAPQPAARQGADSRTPVERLRQSRQQAPAAGDRTDAQSAADRIAAFTAEESMAEENVDEEAFEPYPEDEGEYAYSDEFPVDDLAEDFEQLEPPERGQDGRNEPGEDGPRSYWQLPQSWRSEMPEFRITVLVYAEAADERFLLMNGERLREGDEVDGVVLEEIRRDGAVFSYRQTRFLVKS